MRLAAQVLSVLLHPLWMPTFIVTVAFAVDPLIALPFTDEGRWIIRAMVFVMTAVFPAMSTWMLLRSGLIGSLAMPERRERILPLLLTTLYMAMAYYLLRRTPNHPVTWSIFFGVLLATVLATLCTFRWRISLHMVGIGGLVGALLALSVLHAVYVPALICLAFITAGLLGSARLFIGEHSSMQVYAGALLGTLCTLGCTLFRVYY